MEIFKMLIKLSEAVSSIVLFLVYLFGGKDTQILIFAWGFLLMASMPERTK